MAGGGGSVTPINPVTTPTPLQFVITTSSPIPGGGSTLNIESFIGYNLLFVRGGITQSTIATEPSYYSWNKISGDFQCFPAAVETELFILMPT